MPRRLSPDQILGPTASVWALTDSRDLLFELAQAEQRSVKVTLHRALVAYAEQSADYQAAQANMKRQKRKAAVAA
jgi:hypothetical protein